MHIEREYIKQLNESLKMSIYDIMEMLENDPRIYSVGRTKTHDVKLSIIPNPDVVSNIQDIEEIKSDVDQILKNYGFSDVQFKVHVPDNLKSDKRSLVPLVSTILNGIRGLRTNDAYADADDGYIIHIPIASGSNLTKVKEQACQRLKKSKLSGTLSHNGVYLTLKIQKKSKDGK